MNGVNAYKKTFPALYRGIVEDNIDPKKLGRCKIRVPSVHGELTYPISILPWARPLALSPINSNRGTVNIPDVGDIVWVLFEGADRNFPVYLGGTYATGDIEVETDMVDFYIEKDEEEGIDLRVCYNRKDKVYTVQSGDNKISLSPDGIKIDGDISVHGNISLTGDIIKR